LQQMEAVLDGLNEGTREMVRPLSLRGVPEADNVVSRGVARPNTGIKELVDMVNDVVSDFKV